MKVNPSTTLRTVRVKICGIKNLEDALVSIHNGADFLGFNFVKTSARYISPDMANKIIEKIDRGKIKIVGVFQNESIEKAREVSEFLKLDYIQLYGNEKRTIYSEIRADMINSNNIKTEFYLLDRKIQGKGELVDFGKAAKIASIYPIFLAGGLTPENIGEAIEKVRPFAVDVAGGVETDGGKDPIKIRDFIKRAKSVL